VILLPLRGFLRRKFEESKEQKRLIDEEIQRFRIADSKK